SRLQAAWGWWRGLDACGVEAAVDEGDFAGNGAGERGAEEESGGADLFLLDVAVERSAVGDGVEDGGEVTDAAGGEGVDGAGGDGVDPDFFRAELVSKITHGGLEAGFADAHDVVVGEDLFGAVVGEGEDGGAFGHERGGDAGDRDERVDADVVGDGEVVAGGGEDRVLDVGGEADGVDDGVNRGEF